MEFNDQSYVRSTKLLDFCPRRVYLSDESEHDSKHLWISNFEPVISENLFTTSCSMCAKQLIRPSEWKAIWWMKSNCLITFSVFKINALISKVRHLLFWLLFFHLFLFVFIFFIILNSVKLHTKCCHHVAAIICQWSWHFGWRNLWLI